MEMVVGIGILGAMTLGTMTFMKNMGTAQKTQDYRQEIQATTDEIFKILSNREACKNSFPNMLASADSPTQIMDKSGNVKFRINDLIGSKGVKIKDIKLADTPGMEDMVEVKPGAGGSTRLVFKFEKVESSQSAKYEVQKSINLWVLTDGTNPATARIKECYSMISGGGLLWSKDPADANNIYYNEGNVGVGIENPTNMLDVGGKLAVMSGTEVIDFGGNPSEFEIKLTNNSKPIEFLNESGAPDWANIIAGIIEVKDYVILSHSTGSACDSSNLGAIRYNPGTKMPEICESTGWSSKSYQVWCTPDDRYKEQDDNGMDFWQSDWARREQGVGCDRHQVKRREDNTGWGDLKITNPQYGYEIRHDDSTDICQNNQMCETWRDIDQ